MPDRAPGAPPPDFARVRDLVCALVPYLAGLAWAVTVVSDPKVATAGVTASGRVAFGPAFWLQLDVRERTFVFAHELMHLALDTHGRGTGSSRRAVNIAHDAVINDILEEELDMEPPAGAIRIRGARNTSLEELTQSVRDGRIESPAGAWTRAGPVGRGGALARALAKAGRAVIVDATGDGNVVRPELDVIDDAADSDADDARARATRVREIRSVASAAAALATIRRSFEGTKEDRAAQDTWESEILRGRNIPRWESMLQQWFDATGPRERTFARACRRAGTREDVVLPGTRRAGRTLHLVLDTSGSMRAVMHRALGELAAFASATGVALVHLVECDESVASDRWIDVAELPALELHGGGGSDMGPAIELLAKDPSVTGAVLVTDGFVEYPPGTPPFALLWYVVENPEFSPPYGTVIHWSAG